MGKVQIEDGERALFLTTGEKWTPFQELARDFKNKMAASYWCRERPELHTIIHLVSKIQFTIRDLLLAGSEKRLTNT
ncbi:MAG: hypothetical protein JWM16_1136, partial [Verrucomicrobiales bacterium]|nr:hypothetical protein [Verrucomicrobiales bacterium]